MSSTTPIMNEQYGEASSSKATENGAVEGNGGFVSQAKMSVQPPKQEDLQRSYAKIVSNDANPKGWYGSMSRFLERCLQWCRKSVLTARF